MANSIMAFLGLDRSPFKKGLQEAEQDQVQSAKRMASAEESSSGVRLASVGKLKRGFSELTATIAAGGSATDAMTAAISELGRAFKFGLAGSLAVGGGVVLAKQFIEAADAVEELHKKLREFEKDGANVNFTSLDGLKERLSTATSLAADLHKELKSNWQLIEAAIGQEMKQPGRAIQTAAGNNQFGVPLGAAGLGADLLKTQAKAQQDSDNANADAAKSVEDIAKKGERLLAVEKARAEFGEHTAKLLAIQADLEEKRGAAEKQNKDFRSKTGQDLPVGLLIQSAQADAALKVATENKAFAGRKSAIDTEDAILAVSKKRMDYEVTIAQIRLNAARVAHAAAPAEMKGEMSNKVEEARQAMEEADKRYQAKKNAATFSALDEGAKRAAEIAQTGMLNQEKAFDEELGRLGEINDARKSEVDEENALRQKLHIDELGRIAAEKSARLQQALQTPQQRRSLAAEARREKRASETLDKQDAMRKHDREANNSGDTRGELRRRLHPGRIARPGDPDFIGPVQPLVPPHAIPQPGDSDFIGPTQPLDQQMRRMGPNSQIGGDSGAQTLKSIDSKMDGIKAAFESIGAA